jgi:hypothetical protein
MTVSVEDLLNTALMRSGYPTRIGNIFEGSAASRAALEFYGQTRDNLFGARDWNFLRQQVSLGNPIKTAPPGGYPPTRPWNAATDPPVPWVYEYAYPANCIEIRSLRPTSVVIPEFTPVFTRFTTGDDTATGSKVVLTNLLNANAIITGRVTDPNTWQDSNFSESLIDALAEQFQKWLPLDPNKIQMAETDTQRAIEVAQARPG